VVDIARERLRAVGAAFLVRRPLVVAPAAAVLVGLLAASGAPRAQLGALGGGISLLVAFFVWEALRFRRQELGERHLFVSLLVTVVALTLGCLVTGAIRSPVLPLLFAPSVIAFAAFGRARPAWQMLGLLLAAFLLLAAARSPFPPVAAPWDRWMLLDAAVASALLLHVGVAGLTAAHAGAAIELAAARRDLEAMGARVAHEIKNPLAAVRSLVELVHGNVDERARGRLAVVLGEVGRIDGIVKDYLRLSRPVAELRREPTDLLRLLREVAASLEAGGVPIHVDGEELVAAVDPARLREALFNLLDNAVHAGGEVRATVRRDGGAVEILVEDGGAGLSDAALARIGTPFFTTREGGTGLGVALARAVIVQHGGTLAYARREGGGTVAAVRLG
jgi:signal transduction histidine kinase